MKHNRFSIGLAALLLTLAVFLKAHSARKTITVTTAYYRGGAAWITLFSGAAFSALTTTFNPRSAKIVTTFGSHTLYAEPNSTHPLYVN